MTVSESKQAYMSAYRAENADRLRAQARENYLKNADDRRAYARAKAAAMTDEDKVRKRQQDRESYQRHAESRRARVAAYKASNLEKARKACRASWAKNRNQYADRRRVYVQARLAGDLDWKLERATRSRIGNALRKHLAGQPGKGNAGLNGLGCTIADLRIHIERQFSKGMTWKNWSRTGWHIDHIRALAEFDLTDPAQLAAACHFTNLRPIWAIQNLQKGARREVLL